jgi:hypothetical protein
MRAAFQQGQAQADDITVIEACRRFLLAIQDGTALSKRGRPYKKNTIKSIEGILNGRIARELGSLPLDSVRRSQFRASWTRWSPMDSLAATFGTY